MEAANLLILGAGQYGQVVREIAEAMGCYNKITFLDDRSSEAIGKLEDYQKFLLEYSNAIVAIGNPDIRKEWMERLVSAGFILPVFKHPNAIVSPSAEVAAGTIIEAGCVINSQAIIGKGCIISANAVINHNAKVGEFSHCDCGSIIAGNAEVPTMSKGGFNEIYRLMETEK